MKRWEAPEITDITIGSTECNYGGPGGGYGVMYGGGHGGSQGGMQYCYNPFQYGGNNKCGTPGALDDLCRCQGGISPCEKHHVPGFPPRRDTEPLS